VEDGVGDDGNDVGGFAAVGVLTVFDEGFVLLLLCAFALDVLHHFAVECHGEGLDAASDA
jgi:hypothetical protein